MKTLLFLFLLAQTQIPLAEITTTVTPDYEEISVPLDGGCSLACAMGWTLTSTSELKSNGKINYTAKNMDDGSPHTAWAEGVNGYGIGERIIATMNNDTTIKNISCWGMRIANGYQKNTKTWKDNSRIKKLKVWHNSKPVLIINLQDKMGVQLARWDENLIKLNGGDLLSFEIMEVYKGDKYADTVVSDFVLDGAH